MNFKSRLFLCLIVSPLLASVSQATKVSKFGAISGGGGQGVVCPVPGGEPTVQLLDLWEAETLYSEKTTLRGTNLSQLVDQALLGLENSYPIFGTCDETNPVMNNQECALHLMHLDADIFLKPSPGVHRLHNVTLSKTDDAYEVAKPSGCEIEQIINYQSSGNILVNQDLFDKLDLPNQAALIAHEAYYKFLRGMGKETNSIRVRRAIGYVMSGHSFNLEPSVFPAKSIDCWSDDKSTGYDSVSFYPAPGVANVPDHEIFEVFQLTGSRLIGANTQLPIGNWPFDFNSNDPILSACAGTAIPSEHIPVRITSFSGPVESDRGLDFRVRCGEAIPRFFIETTRPGQSEEILTEVKCDYVVHETNLSK